MLLKKIKIADPPVVMILSADSGGSAGSVFQELNKFQEIKIADRPVDIISSGNRL